ncbi:MAG: HAMP domain-containing protein [Treponema sp.]|jgi:HAMP domain-containing protein/HPt (histidine-containing phosphotransfer) domain-containing protein|nr:HAMP domain-containing protein [Treponema sp.]
MKKSIWKKIIFFVAVPFLLIFALISVLILETIYSEKIREVKQDTRKLALYNEMSLRSFLENSRLSVKIAASELEHINPEDPGARNTGDRLIIAMLKNQAVVNSWLVFEPDAFDGRDAEHAGEYPGAPSGRYMRSFSLLNGKVTIVNDMNEKTIDDPEEGYCYAIPKKTEKPYIDIIGESENLFWDYKTGEGPLNTFTVVSPVFRENRFIGCIGVDISLSSLALGDEFIKNAVSMLIDPNGTVVHARNFSTIGRHIEDLQFSAPGAILDAFDEQREIQITSEKDPVFGSRAYVLFHPVFIDGIDKPVYVYAGIPESEVIRDVRPVITPVIISLLAVVGVFAVLIFYIYRSISSPIHILTMASDKISQGDLEEEIPVFDSADELGILSRSLNRMAEQFRLHLGIEEQNRQMLELYTRLNSAIYKHQDNREVLDAILRIICRNYNVSTATMICLEKGKAIVYSSKGESSWPHDSEFPYHWQVVSFIKGKKYASFNAHSLKEAGLIFTSRYSLFLCILPLFAGEELMAYVIMESGKERGPFINDDTSLTFIQDIVSYAFLRKRSISASREDPNEGQLSASVKKADTASVKPQTPEAPLLPEEKMTDKEPDPLQAARAIEGLDVDRGLILLAGSAEQYLELIKFSASVFQNSIDRMDSALENDDLPAFAIEVHGAKGALNNIGASSLGEEALYLEKKSKAGNGEFCKINYPAFRKKLAALAGSLVSLETKTDNGNTAETGAAGAGVSAEELSGVLKKAAAACERYDSFRAQEYLAPYIHNADLDEETGKKLAFIDEKLNNVDYDEALAAIRKLLETSGEG